MTIANGCLHVPANGQYNTKFIDIHQANTEIVIGNLTIVIEVNNFKRNMEINSGSSYINSPKRAAFIVFESYSIFRLLQLISAKFDAFLPSKTRMSIVQGNADIVNEHHVSESYYLFLHIWAPHYKLKTCFCKSRNLSFKKYLLF